MTSKNIAKELNLENCIQKYDTTECSFTLKDQKEDFISRPRCRVIFLAKNKLGKIGQEKIANIYREIRYTTGVNKWQNTQSVLNWFNRIDDPGSYMILKFNIESFYPSIKSKLL